MKDLSYLFPPCHLLQFLIYIKHASQHIIANHVERVHEYGETFEIYPCEECGFRGTDITSIRIHIANSHENNSTASKSPEDLGIVKLPVVTKRRKQNLKDLIIDDNGDIELEDEDEDDEDFNSRDELLLIEEEDFSSTKSLRRRKPLERKRKVVDEQVQETKGRKWITVKICSSVCSVRFPSLGEIT